MRRPVPTTRGGKEPDPAPEYFRVAFDGPALAAELNTDFTAFCRKYAEYVADPAENAFSMRPSSAAPSMNMPQPPSVFYLGSYLKTPTDSILLTLCVEKDDYDNVKTITAAPEDPAKSLDVWQYCLTSAEALRLGTFLGTKYKSPSSSGVFQTIDDTLNHIAQHGTAETLACTIFGVVPQAAYAVFQLDNGAFSARLMNSYLKLDYPAMRRWLGGDHAAFAAEYYVLGNKINAFGDLYVYFYYAKDAAGNTFTVDVHADKNGEKISEIDVYVSADRNDADKQLAIWKEYARDYADQRSGRLQRGLYDRFVGRPERDVRRSCRSGRPCRIQRPAGSLRRRHHRRFRSRRRRHESGDEPAVHLPADQGPELQRRITSHTAANPSGRPSPALRSEINRPNVKKRGASLRRCLFFLTFAPAEKRKLI